MAAWQHGSMAASASISRPVVRKSHPLSTPHERTPRLLFSATACGWQFSCDLSHAYLACTRRQPPSSKDQKRNKRNKRVEIDRKIHPESNTLRPWSERRGTSEWGDGREGRNLAHAKNHFQQMRPKTEGTYMLNSLGPMFRHLLRSYLRYLALVRVQTLTTE